MAFFILYVISTRNIHIRPRDEVPRSNMGRGLTEQKYSYDSNIPYDRRLSTLLLRVFVQIFLYRPFK